MGWTIEVLGFDSRRGLGIFLFTTASRTALGPSQPPMQWVPGALSLGVKRPVREADHSHLVPKSKNEWSYTSVPQYAFMAWCSTKSTGTTFTLPVPRFIWSPQNEAECKRSLKYRNTEGWISSNCSDSRYIVRSLVSANRPQICCNIEATGSYVGHGDFVTQ
jgi:hypothetical protein